MRPRGAFLCGVLLGCAGLSAGCAGLSGQPALPEDPLLVSKKPVRGKAEFTPPVFLARAEPVLPPEPAPTLLAASPALRREIGAARELNAVPVNVPRPQPREDSRPATPTDSRRTVSVPNSSTLTPISARQNPVGFAPAP